MYVHLVCYYLMIILRLCYDYIKIGSIIILSKTIMYVYYSVSSHSLALMSLVILYVMLIIVFDNDNSHSDFSYNVYCCFQSEKRYTSCAFR